MSDLGKLLGVPAGAEAAWISLAQSLQSMTDEGRAPVCAQRPDDWSADASGKVREQSAEACTWCPVVEACRRYGSFERTGVWGGVDRSARSSKLRAA